jgi:hypothetical protein
MEILRKVNYKEMRQLASGYLTSSSAICHKEYGRVLLELLKRYDAYAGDALSDEMLFSDLAEGYIEEQKRSMMFVKDREDYKARIRFAAKFVVPKNSQVPVSMLVEALSSGKKVEELPYYNRIHPSTLKMAVEKLSRS